MSNKGKKIINIIFYVILIVFSFSIINKVNDNLKEKFTIDEDNISYYVDGIQTQDISNIDVSLYNISVTCNNGVNAEWDYNTKAISINNLANGVNHFKCNVSLEEKAYLMQASGTYGSTAVFLNTTLLKNEIESIEFMVSNEVPNNVIGSFDVSHNGSEKIMLWYYDNDNNGLYEIYVGQNGGVIANSNSSYLFYSMNALANLKVDNLNTSNVNNMNYLFGAYSSSYANKLTNINVSNLDTSQVISMSFMFVYCSNLTDISNINKFDTSQVNTMQSMFNNCSSLTSLDLYNFDTSKVTSMANMFSQCKSLTYLNVTSFDTSQVTTMYYMFSFCRKLTNIGIDEFNTSEVKNMSGMFYDCSGLTSLNVGRFVMSKVTTVNYMFYNCYGLTSLNVKEFDTSSIKDISYMFQSCSGLTSIDVSKFDTSSVTNMAGMFSNCSGLTTLDLSNFDTSKVTGMSYLFNYCNKLTYINMSGADFSNVTTYTSMFYNVPSGEIKVKDSTQKTWIETNTDFIGTINIA